MTESRGGPLVPGSDDPAGPGAAPPDPAEAAIRLQLRRRAEARAEAAPPRDLRALAPEEARRALYELQVHQIELEMQNQELRRTQKELEASRARLQDLFEEAPVGYVTLDASSVILEANRTAIALLGETTPAMLRRQLFQFVLPEDRDALYLHLRRLKDTGQSQVCELRLARPDASSVWIRLDSTVVEDPETGERISRVAMTDVTARKQAEDALREAERMEAVGQLAGGMAHHFNNLLMIINGFATVVLDGLRLDHPDRQSLQAVRSAGERAAVLTQQLLAFSRRQGFRQAVLDLNQLLADMEQTLRRLFGRSVELVLDLAPEPLLVTADRRQIEQAVMSLAMNALDAMPAGGTLTVRVEAKELDGAHVTEGLPVTPGSYVVLTMSDTGRGMDEATRLRVFEPFFTTKEVGQGTGLALAAVFGIVKQSEGHIDVASQPGRGASFRVFLPRHRSTAPPAAGRRDTSP